MKDIMVFEDRAENFLMTFECNLFGHRPVRDVTTPSKRKQHKGRLADQHFPDQTCHKYIFVPIQNHIVFIAIRIAVA